MKCSGHNCSKTRSEVKVIVTQKVVRDTLSSKDASTHLIWNSFLKEYISYALDLMPILETRSEVKVTVTKNGTGQSVIPKCICTPNCHQRCIYTPNLEFLPQRYKRCAPDTIILKTRSEVKVKVTVTRKWYVTLRHPRMHLHNNFGIPTSKNIGDMHQTQSRFKKLDQRSRSISQGPKDGARRFVISRCIQTPYLGFLKIPNLGFLP